MTSTAEGITTPSDSEKVNSESGFAAALKSKGFEPDKGIVEGGEASSDTSVLAGLETVEPTTPARGPDGKFVAKAATPEDTPQQGADTSTGEQFTSDDPAVAEFLKKYDGNLEEAIKGAAHAQSLIGRRDDERDQMAQRLAQLEGLVEGLKAGAAPAVTAPALLSDEEVEQRASEQVASKGYLGAAAEAAEWADQTGDNRPLKSIFDQWNIEDPWAATNFIADHRARTAVARATSAAPAATGADPWVEDRKTAEGMAATFTALKSELGQETFNALLASDASGESALTKALATLPAEVQKLVVSDDADTRLAGTRIAANTAIASGLVQAAPAAPTEDQGMPASVARKLAGAGVATAGLRPVTQAGGSGDQQTLEEATRDFKNAILEAETTSVASGLTYGKQ